MNVLLDTNVLLSAALRNRLPEKVVLYVATHSECRWITTTEILAEYSEILRRPKFNLSAATVQSWAQMISMRTITIPNPPSGPTLQRDPKDAPFVAAAISSEADYLITGDKDLLQSNLSIKTRIVSVADFAASFHIE